MYLLFEICDRVLYDVLLIDSLENAVKTANERLEAHAKKAGFEDELTNGALEGNEFKHATEDAPNAWSSISDDWDAHVVEFTKGKDFIMKED